jgi:hypothetical protein
VQCDCVNVCVHARVRPGVDVCVRARVRVYYSVNVCVRLIQYFGAEKSFTYPPRAIGSVRRRKKTLAIDNGLRSCVCALSSDDVLIRRADFVPAGR